MQTWMILGFSAFAGAILASMVAARQGRWSRPALAVAALNLLFAGMSSSAPFRGLLDQGYVGYRFGLLAADRPIAVFLMAGSVLLAASLAAVVAASNRTGRSMMLVAAVDAALLLNESGSIIKQARTSRDFEIQFGEILTIPSSVGMFIALFLFLVPLGWATISAVRKAHVPGRLRFGA